MTPTEVVINWIEFLYMLPFMMYGLIIYVLIKFVAARLRSDFTSKVFFDRNVWSWILGLLINILMCYLFVGGIDIGIHFRWDVVAIVLGLSGGSIGKGVIKILIGLNSLKKGK